MRKARQFRDQLFMICGFAALLLAIFVLMALISDLFFTGFPRISQQFLLSFPSRFADRAGILSAWVGSVCVMLITAVFAIPVGIASGIYLEEYASKNFLTAFIEINISNLAGVPSIIFGLLAL